MADFPASHDEVRARVLAAYESEYQDLVETWKLLETKAQGAIAISAIFLAGAFSFAKDLKAETSTSFGVALSLSIVSLLFTVIMAVRSLGVRSAARLPSGATISSVARPMMETAEEGLRLIRHRFLEDLCELLHSTNDELAKALVKKAKQLQWSQRCLTLAGGSFVVYTLIVIFTR